MTKGKEWLQEELEKLFITQSYDHRAFVDGNVMPVKGSYNVEDVDKLVAQLGTPIDGQTEMCKQGALEI